MIGRRSFLAALVGLACPGTAIVHASDLTPKAFIEGIYAAYKGSSDTSKGIDLTTDAAVRRYFEPQLAALMIKDINAAKGRREVPRLDGDPFIDGQDWEIDSLVVTAREQGTDTATGTVSFKNFGAATTVTIELVRARPGWRIADIKWADRRSLRGLYAKR
jgi:hypothetical protein